MRQLTWTLLWSILMFWLSAIASINSENRTGGDGIKVDYRSWNTSRILKELRQNYDANVRPFIGVRPVIVYVDIDVLGINAISEKHMEFSFHCYFRQKWWDHRLRFEASNTTIIPLNPQKGLQEFWHPDTYIRNGKNSFLHRLTVPNRLLRLRATGELMLSQRLTITARCIMKLNKFPMDTQRCPLIIGSLAYSNHEVQYKWYNLELYDANSSSAQMSQFQLINLTMAEIADAASMAHRGEKVSLLTGEFVLHREMGYFVLQIYLPCSMIVTLSWVSFWINKEAAIARCSLGVTTILTLTTLRQGVEDEFPPIDYATAIDVFMLVCFFFCYAALFEYIVIHFTTLTERHSGGRKKRDDVASTKKNTVMMLAKSMPGAGVVSDTRRRQSRLREYFGWQSAPEVSRWDSLLKDYLTKTYVHQLRLRTSISLGIDFEEVDVYLKTQRDSVSSGAINLEQTWFYAVEKLDRCSKYIFPVCFCLFHAVYWLLYLFLLPD